MKFRFRNERIWLRFWRRLVTFPRNTHRMSVIWIHKVTKLRFIIVFLYLEMQTILYQYREMQGKFKETHRAYDQLQQQLELKSEQKKDLKAMEEDKNQLLAKINKIAKRIEQIVSRCPDVPSRLFSWWMQAQSPSMDGIRQETPYRTESRIRYPW